MKKVSSLQQGMWFYFSSGLTGRDAFEHVLPLEVGRPIGCELSLIRYGTEWYMPGSVQFVEWSRSFKTEILYKE